MKFIYLASPYSHPDAEIREARYVAACQKAAEYASAEQAVFAPIVHSHPMAAYMAEEDRMNFALWMKLDLPILRFADELHVLCLDGWRSSRGVQREIEFADSMNIPVRQVFP